jgi:hypothetical protein
MLFDNKYKDCTFVFREEDRKDKIVPVYVEKNSFEVSYKIKIDSLQKIMLKMREMKSEKTLKERERNKEVF